MDFLIDDELENMTSAYINRPEPEADAVNYLLKMEGPLAHLDTIKLAAGDTTSQKKRLSEITGTDPSSGDPARFCIVDHPAKTAIEAWLAAANMGLPFHATFIPYATGAAKALSSFSLAPTLGVDTTLPHLRMDTAAAAATEPQPTQDQFPVWYFFYGTLRDAGVLRRLLGIEKPVYRPARVRGGKLVEWGGRYKALVDAATPGSVVEGAAFLVESEGVEDALRHYETDRYEVVRCEIGMGDDGSVVKGLTFRFVG